MDHGPEFTVVLVVCLALTVGAAKQAAALLLGRA